MIWIRIFQMHIRYNVVLLLSVIFSVATSSYGAVSELNKISVNSVRAIVGDDIITQGELVRHAAVAIREAQGRYKGHELADKIDEILKNTLEEMINRKILVKEANRIFGTNAAAMKEVQNDLDSFLKGAVNKVGSLSKYYEIAEAQGINPIEKKNELKEDIMIDKIMKEHVYNRVKIQPKLLRRYYCENIDEFRQKKEVKLRHIMIKFSSHNNNREETLSRAQQVMRHIIKGDDFATLARQYSEGPHAEEGGLWSFEEVSELRKDLRDVVYSLKDNEYSRVVESPVGYHIFKAELVKPEETQDFQEVQDEIYQRIYREEISRLKKQYINSLKEGVFIKIVQ
ncbi:MAG: hypothetical protein E3K32_08890 [wastewater metagenome]|nr:hypothetical protein [Candidatus Loosdrechtia aerotolerans]